MTKSKKKRIVELPSKCVYCGGKRFKSDSDLNKAVLLPNGNLRSVGPVLCRECGGSYMKTEVFEIKGAASE